MRSNFSWVILFLLAIPSLACSEEIIIRGGESPTILLRGNIELKSFYGPPNYGETPKIDIPEKYYFINLEQAINVREEAGNEFKNTRSLQIVFDRDRKLDIERIDMAKKVLVTGKLFLAETGHHHSDVLIFVEGISNI